MSDANLARRIQSAAWRSAGDMPEHTVRNWHDADMRVLGKGRQLVDADAIVEDAASLLTRPSSLAFIFLIAFAVILAGLMWREGRFDGMVANLTPKVIPPSGSWIESAKSLGLNAPAQTQTQPAPPSFENELEKAERRQQDLTAPPKVIEDAGDEQP